MARHALEGTDRGGVVALGQFEPAFDHAGAHAVAVGGIGVADLARAPASLRLPSAAFSASSQWKWAMTLPIGSPEVFSYLQRVLDRLVPVALELVDRDQLAQRLRRMHAHLHQVGEQGFGAIEQAGAHVVLAQREHAAGLLFLAQAVPRNQALVQADGAIDFAAAAEQVAERELGLDRVLVDLGDLQEDLDRLVLLLVEQVVQAAEVGVGQARLPARRP